MKNKKIILSLALPLLISCGQNNHDFSIKWENDENYHWHVCQIEGHNDTSEKEKHIWDNAIAILKEIANMKGYELFIDINNGYKIKMLATLKAEKLPEDFKPIDEIIEP